MEEELQIKGLLEKGLSDNEISENLNISVTKIEKIRKSLKFFKSKKWENEDVLKLKELYATKTTKEISAILNRPVSSVRKILSALGLTPRGKEKRGKWTKQQDDILINLTKDGKSVKEICKIINKTYYAVMTRKGVLKISQKTNKIWTEENIKTLKILKENKTPCVQIARIFNLTPISVSRKLEELGLDDNYNKCWSTEKVEKLKKLITEEKESIERVALILEIKKTYVKRKCEELFLKVERKSVDRKFTEKEISVVRAMISNGDSVKSIALFFNCLPNTIYSIARQNDIYIPKRKDSFWSSSDKEVFKQMLDDGCSVDEICEKLDKKPWGVIQQVSRMGLSGTYKQIAAKRKILKSGYYSDLEGCLKERLVRARGRAKNSKKRYEFSLELKDLLDIYTKQKGKCFYTNREMVFINNHPNTLSLDRIDSSKGYTKDNIVLTIWLANYMKQDLSINEFQKICKEIIDNNPVEKLNQNLTSCVSVQGTSS